MLEFVVCDDDKLVVEKVSNIITKQMMKNKFEYKILKFYDYDNNFMNLIYDAAFRIYLLDIEMPSRSGIDIARLIRKYNLESIIIFVTGHYELGYSIIEEELNFLTFINKFNDCENKLGRAINKSLLLANKKSRIKFEDKGVLYTISLDDILYIVRNIETRKIDIITSKVTYSTNLSLTQIKTLLDDRFVASHRSCIVNTSRIVSIDKRQNIITFDNQNEINFLSNNYKKGLCEYVN